jgi:tRNA (guanine-N7-)-methyltransferase
MNIEKNKVENIRLIRGDAICILSDHLQLPYFEDVFIFFPNPWPNHNDHRRWIVQDFSLDIISRNLKSGAHLHIATDDKEYAKHILQTLVNKPEWKNTSEGSFSTRPTWRPITKYESKAIEKKERVYDICFRYSPSSTCS